MEDRTLDGLATALRETPLLDVIPAAEEGVYVPTQDKCVDPDEYLQTVIAIHFDEIYGAPYWNERHDDLKERYGEGFDVREEIETFDDLSLLPEADEDALRERPVRDFIPRLFYDEPPGTNETYEELDVDTTYYEFAKSSGTKGKKKTVPWGRPLSDEVTDWYNHVLDHFDTGDGDWLVVGPYGVFEKHHDRFVAERGGFSHFNGLEPAGKKDILKARAAVDRSLWNALDPMTLYRAVRAEIEMGSTYRSMRDDLASEHITGLSIGPPMLEDVHGWLSDERSVSSPEDIEAVILGGLSITEDTIERAEQLYEDAIVLPMYATSFTGPSFDVGEETIDYHPLEPVVTFDVVEKDRPFDEAATVDYGEEGRLVFHRVAEDFFWPNQTERHMVTRMPPRDGFETDGISYLRPMEDG